MVKNKSLSIRKLLFPYIETKVSSAPKLLFSLIETTFTYIGTTTHEPKR